MPKSQPNQPSSATVQPLIVQSPTIGDYCIGVQFRTHVFCKNSIFLSLFDVYFTPGLVSDTQGDTQLSSKTSAVP